MRVLSFDQGTRLSGWGYCESVQDGVSGVIDMSKSKLETAKRSFEMAKELWKIIKKYKRFMLVLAM